MASEATPKIELVQLTEAELEMLLILLREGFVRIMEGNDSPEVKDDLLGVIVGLQHKPNEEHRGARRGRR